MSLHCYYNFNHILHLKSRGLHIINKLRWSLFIYIFSTQFRLFQIILNCFFPAAALSLLLIKMTTLTTNYLKEAGLYKHSVLRFLISFSQVRWHSNLFWKKHFTCYCFWLMKDNTHQNNFEWLWLGTSKKEEKIYFVNKSYIIRFLKLLKKMKKWIGIINLVKESKENVWVGIRERVETQWWPFQSRKEPMLSCLLLERQSFFKGGTRIGVVTNEGDQLVGHLMIEGTCTCTLCRNAILIQNDIGNERSGVKWVWYGCVMKHANWTIP